MTKNLSPASQNSKKKLKERHKNKDRYKEEDKQNHHHL